MVRCSSPLWWPEKLVRTYRHGRTSHENAACVPASRRVSLAAVDALLFRPWRCSLLLWSTKEGLSTYHSRILLLLLPLQLQLLLPLPLPLLLLLLLLLSLPLLLPLLPLLPLLLSLLLSLPLLLRVPHLEWAGELGAGRCW